MAPPHERFLLAAGSEPKSSMPPLPAPIFFDRSEQKGAARPNSHSFACKPPGVALPDLSIARFKAMKLGSFVGEMIGSDQLARRSIVQPHGPVGPETDLKIRSLRSETQNGVDRQRAESLLLFSGRKTEQDRFAPGRCKGLHSNILIAQEFMIGTIATSHDEFWEHSFGARERPIIDNQGRMREVFEIGHIAIFYEGGTGSRTHAWAALSSRYEIPAPRQAEADRMVRFQTCATEANEQCP